MPEGGEKRLREKRLREERPQKERLREKPTMRTFRTAAAERASSPTALHQVRYVSSSETRRACATASSPPSLFAAAPLRRHITKLTHPQLNLHVLPPLRRRRLLAREQASERERSAGERVASLMQSLAVHHRSLRAARAHIDATMFVLVFRVYAFYSVRHLETMYTGHEAEGRGWMGGPPVGGLSYTLRLS